MRNFSILLRDNESVIFFLWRFPRLPLTWQFFLFRLTSYWFELGHYLGNTIAFLIVYRSVFFTDPIYYFLVRSWFVVRVWRLFLDGLIYLNITFLLSPRCAFCSVRTVSHQGGPQVPGISTGHGHRKKQARIKTITPRSKHVTSLHRAGNLYLCFIMMVRTVVSFD